MDESTRDDSPRKSPLAWHVPLWIGFLLVVVIGVATVLYPEITDEGSDEDGAVDGDDEAAEPEAE